jgi:hypothetical protein
MICLIRKVINRELKEYFFKPLLKTIFANLILRLLTGAKYFEIDS